ncbi:MAG: hypothetical protein IKF78_03785 [Atopobiaceae bacterium]|nr:hypothetical protein [Atopobiaceae bacterium]
MGKRVYISADYSENDGDRAVVDELHKWGEDSAHKVDYIDTAQVVSGSVTRDPDCRACDLKAEFNSQINASSAALFIVGDKTAHRNAGSTCRRNAEGELCPCTPYKQNAGGTSLCKVHGTTYTPGPEEDVGTINTYSYLEHEFRQAVKKRKTIIIVYNSFYRQYGWLPSYMRDYDEMARPFWKKDALGRKVGDYQYIKQALGYE